MFLEIYIYKNHIFWKSNLLTQPDDVAESGIIYKNSIGCVEKIKTNFGGGVQLIYNFPKPSFTIIKDYLSAIYDKVNNVDYTGQDIDTDEKIINIFNSLA